MTSRFFEIGRIGRARGLDGWVRFLPENSLVDEFLSESPIVYFKNDRGGFQPLRIEEFYTEEKKNQVSFFVKFDMITNRTDAESLNDKGIYSDRFDPLAELESNDSDTETDLSGYEIQYKSEVPGYVLDTFETPAHTILEVKTDSGSLLIPFVDEFIEQVNHEKNAIICRNLDQLMDE
ncbi:16S rRNA processing protein RimM [Rhodohalobacter sp. SW132]|uniref:ribosome maturation factor RimM n=1 Tax=Rhodohalobacter sp. SW132 TaxID=2293433 RepID=UPI000E247CE6|nr:ribosome maturation factor RimM [Rhodohalobacter sp. SW132]REL39167.1 16S rRNA processing protein RimM [Rhodohalobacter sp. SW132]